VNGPPRAIHAALRSGAFDVLIDPSATTRERAEEELHWCTGGVCGSRYAGYAGRIGL